MLIIPEDQPFVLEENPNSTMKKHCLKLRGPDVEHLVPPPSTTTSKFSNTNVKWCLRIADRFLLGGHILRASCVNLGKSKFQNRPNHEMRDGGRQKKIERERSQIETDTERERATNITNQNLQMDIVS